MTFSEDSSGGRDGSRVTLEESLSPVSLENFGLPSSNERRHVPGTTGRTVFSSFRKPSGRSGPERDGYEGDGEVGGLTEGGCGFPETSPTKEWTLQGRGLERN